MKTFKMELKLITPVIVHTGDCYNPIEVLPLEKEVLVVSPEKLFSKIPANEQSKFFSLIESGTKENALMAKMSFLKFAKNNSDCHVRKCPASDNFRGAVSENPYANINKIFMNDLSGRPYIPGSTIKGAIRTAMLENLRVERDKQNAGILYKHGNSFVKYNDYELKLIEADNYSRQNVSNDPFKFLKVSDFEVQSSDIYFDTVRVVNKGGTAGKGIPVYTEMTDSYLSAKKEILAVGTITIDDNCCLLSGDRNNPQKHDYKWLFNFSNIIKNTDDFYYNNLSNTTNHTISKCYHKMIEDNGYQGFANNEAIIRLGRFTQIESKTFKIIRENEFDRKNKPIPEDININGGISRTLINGEIPAGWCILKVAAESISEYQKESENLSSIKPMQASISTAKPTVTQKTNTINNTVNTHQSTKDLLREGDIVEIKILSVDNPISNAETVNGKIKGTILIRDIAKQRIDDPNKFLKIGDIKKAKVSYRESKGRRFLNFSLKDVDSPSINGGSPNKTEKATSTLGDNPDLAKLIEKFNKK